MSGAGFWDRLGADLNRTPTREEYLLQAWGALADLIEDQVAARYAAPHLDTERAALRDRLGTVGAALHELIRRREADGSAGAPLATGRDAGFVDTALAAELTGYSEPSIRRLAGEGAITAYKQGRGWLIPRAALAGIAPNKPGRKPAPPPATLARLRTLFPPHEREALIAALRGSQPRSPSFIRDLPANVALGLRGPADRERYRLDPADLTDRLRGLDLAEREALLWATRRHYRRHYEAQLGQGAIYPADALFD